MYYGMIIGSVILFGTSFFFQDEYRKIRGSSLKISMQYSIPGTIAGLFILLIINRFCLSFTPFTLIMAVVNSVNGLLMGFCSFKALGKINLSLFSVFCMLGGMVLPFLQGICFYGEPLTVSKILCFMLIVAALMLTVEKSDKKSGAIYYMGVFVLNGMSGVITKLYNELPFEKSGCGNDYGKGRNTASHSRRYRYFLCAKIKAPWLIIKTNYDKIFLITCFFVK